MYEAAKPLFHYRIRNLRKSDRLIKVYAEIGGGPYKYLRYDEDGDMMPKYKLEKDTRNYFASLEFYLRPDGE